MKISSAMVSEPSLDGQGGRCLIVSPHFPPSTLAGVHRARHLAKHLPAHGWKPTVICVDPKYHIEKLDLELAELVPSTIDVVRTPALPVALTRPFGVAGDIGLRGYMHLRAAAARSLAQDRPDIVLITGSPYYPMLMAGWIRRRWNVPVVLDFQDPWVSREGSTRRRLSKAGVAYRLAVALEPHAVRAASFITSVSDRQNDEMTARYPYLHRARMAAIPIGGDPDDFEVLRGCRTSGGRASAHLSDDVVNISYVGTIWPPVRRTLQAVLCAVALLRRRSPVIANRMRLNFVGTTANPNDHQGYRVMPLAKDLGIADLLYEVPERRPYLEALRLMAQTEINLMIGSGEPHYTASKIYPVLMSGRPYFSLFHRTSSAHEILVRAGGGVALAFETPEELEALVPVIAQALEQLAKDPASLGRIDPTAYAPYTAHAVAGRFAKVFEMAAGDG